MPKSEWSRKQDRLEGIVDNDSESVGVWVTVKAVTDKAILCDADGEEHWIPISQIDVAKSDDLFRKGAEGTAWIPRWLAKEKGIVGDFKPPWHSSR